MVRVITKSYEVYTLKELKKVSLVGYKEALNEISESLSINIMEFDSNDILASIKKFCEQFNIKILEWSFSLYHYNNYIKTDIDQYRYKHDNSEIKDHVKELNILIDCGSDCANLTGTYTDQYLIDFFIDNNIKKVDYNNIHKLLKYCVDYALITWIKDQEDLIANDEALLEFAENMDMDQWTIGGELFRC